MTKNQIDYARLLEDRRSHLASEAFQSLQHRESIALQRDALSETERSNRAREAYNLMSLDETKRHNTATETLSLQQFQESARHNRATEANEQMKTAETIRANQANEQLKTLDLEEKKRSNLASDITRAAELAAKVVESERSLAVTKEQNAARNALETARLAETVRHNTVMEGKNFTPSISVSPVTNQGATNVKVDIPAAETHVSVQPKVTINLDQPELKHGNPYVHFGNLLGIPGI